jgi:hypothetical protein
VNAWTGHLTVDHSQPGPDGRPDATATFSPCRSYRYDLTRTWQPDRPVAVFIMLNPSTADATVVDPTVRRCIGYAKAWGAGGLLVLNAFALRSTNPAALHTAADPVGPDNDLVISHHFSAVAPHEVGPVVAAWGVHAALNGRDRRVLALLDAYRVRPLAPGVTEGGYPRHPLYLPRDAVAVPYRGAA